MGSRKAHAGHECGAGGELSLVLPGEADNDIGGDCQIGDLCACALDQLRELRCGIAAAHTLQRGIASALQGQVQVAAQA